MNVFVTDSTGYKVKAVVEELFRTGHNVTGLVRSKEKGDKLKDLGIHTLLGNLNDTDLLEKAASENQAVRHQNNIVMAGAQPTEVLKEFV